MKQRRRDRENARKDVQATRCTCAAEEAIGRLALECIGTYTIYGATEGWTDLDTGEEYTEDTVVVVLIGASAEEARILAEKAGRLLDQKSVLVAGSASSTEYIEP